jgi:inorganic pyrophosphatase
MSHQKEKAALADPSKLELNEKGKEIKVIIETPKGSRNKYAFDQEKKVFALKRVLPSGMAFPYDFGFVPSTLAEDGDPVDVLVLMDEPAFPGCLLHCRMIGVIQGKQGKGKKSERNDRVVAVEADNHAWSNIEHVDDLGKEFMKELEEFFVNYHALSGKEYRIVDLKGPGAARKCVAQGIKALRKN